MKGLSGKLLTLCAASLLLSGCEKEEDMLATSKSGNQVMSEECDMISFEGQSGYRNTVESDGGRTIHVAGIARNENDEPVDQNRAMIFDSENWSGDDDDLATSDWGNVLITQQLGYESAPNDNQWGSELRIGFLEPVKLRSMRVLDIDENEHDSWAFVYVEGEDEPRKFYLEPHGDNVGFTVNFGDIENVLKLVVWFDGDGAFGSGAIDNIMFCVPVMVPEPDIECDLITFEGSSPDGYVDHVFSDGGRRVNIAGISRNANDEAVNQNRARIFDSGNWTGDDDDLATSSWGHVLISQQLGDEGDPNDNEWGSELRVSFLEPVMLRSMRVLDIDDGSDGHPSEHDSWAFVYVQGEDEPRKFYLEPHGDNVGFTVEFGNIENVLKLVVWFDGDGPHGSGAIDNISFCVPR